MTTPEDVSVVATDPESKVLVSVNADEGADRAELLMIVEVLVIVWLVVSIIPPEVMLDVNDEAVIAAQT